MINRFESCKWKSVYQQSSFNKVIKDMGLPNSEIITKEGDHIYFFSWEPNDVKQTAWEVSHSIDLQELIIPKDKIILHYIQKGKFEDIIWDSLIDNYYATPVINKAEGPSFSRRFKRSMKKANPNLKHSQAETSTQINTAINFLNKPDHPERRDNFDPYFFKNLVLTFLANSIAEIHVVYDESEISSPLGAAVILKSSNQVNFRWYSNNHEAGIGHIFMYELINTFLKRDEIDVVNLSGMPHPKESNPSLKGIAEFKKQITKSIIVFSANS